MRDVVRGHIFWTAFAVWAIFFPLAALIKLSDLFQLLAGLNIVAGMAVLLSYWPAAKLALKLPSSQLEYADFLTLGIMCSWFAVVARIAYGAYFRTFEPTAITSDYFFAFLQWMNFTAAILHLSARRVMRHGHPETNWPFIAKVAALGTTVGTVFAVLT
jgi:hypothetical protein